jgi:DNA repair photolyase
MDLSQPNGTPFPSTITSKREKEMSNMKKERITPKKKSDKLAHGTQEWAARNVNISKGCNHDCFYCYAKSNAIRFGRCTPESWRNEKVNFTEVKKCETRKPSDAKFDVMFPTSHDISIKNLETAITKLHQLFKAGNTVLIVTKPNIHCVKRICDEFKDKIDRFCFRFSIGSTSSDTLKAWEPNAPSFEHRMKCLKYASEHGFQTSISIEPMLDNNITDLIEQVTPFVTDTIWIGTPNQLMMHISINTGVTLSQGGTKVHELGRQLIRSLNDDYLQQLFNKHSQNPKIRWKDSLKKTFGLEIPKEFGLDI